MKSSLELAAQEHMEKCLYDKESSEFRRHAALCFIAGAKHREAELMKIINEAKKALIYMTEDYDCDPADVADFDKRKAELTLDSINKQLAEMGIE